MKKLQVKPSQLQGRIEIPSSKSHTLRAILFAALADGKSCIESFLLSPDAYAMIAACRAFGAEISLTEAENRLDITGVSGQPKQPDNILDAGNSGQVLRFVGAILGLIPGYSVMTGDHSVRFNRPAQPLIEGLKQLGAECVAMKGDNHAPLIIRGPLQGNYARIDGQDSQPVSALLIASVFIAGETEIIVDQPGELPWVDLTLSWFDRLGLAYQREGYTRFVIPGVQKMTGFNYRVPGDFSSLAYPVAAALVTQSTVTIDNVDLADAQGDKKLLDVLVKMGANFEYDANGKSLQVLAVEKLQGVSFDINEFIDAVTIMAVVACYAEGQTIISGASIARQKESNRLAAITAELQKLGADIKETADGLSIVGGQKLVNQKNLQGYHDHRIVMSMAIAALAATGECEIAGSECVAKSYPSFVEQMQALGVDMRELTCA
ncbi:3-phosphoshikimate 1-carboxyvinyltransferase [Piscirickettsia salmonis]|uniref:3-phosphoshikimate 1-carboxyvinyltransferase n=1 Tax=Piscirickettsia salmonis TaxID=1238 RepID=A0A9Q6PTJ7_PISSA|nr:3-phosphoshikimate 1-carboxyvinyltransferase [Piscirickettsia salmonis]ALA24642.1 3-phosphoshikimate 1-carboxyvinyltransferase [Piscirickettsia salmonis]APS45775.1 3-phosphoshikimate 1-carboxyvinyltransferase [Piscirickettsia salmonis]APS48344.1 3-phosphoshikimate 1-carboxyvinyltransferase [Piscirickettsia salmonis]QGN95445.1 3-phosphoshikimate 1-carboxyvinyltransferase 1 [Piscirickettsia salmonis]QGO05606.1 3-phosphoshikimate 1-carboxyvinyltransferase 1 [Piscirickettsia salmonis]